MKKYLPVRYALRETLGLAGMGVALFLSAGRIDWWPAWAALAVMFLWIVGTGIIIIRINPDLLAERLGPRKGAKTWDTAIMSLLGLTQLSRYILAGLDKRFGWTGGFPLAAQIFALALCFFGYFMVVWATASNAFFSQIVRIQSERGHKVVNNGPYAFMRHPGYSGAILYELAVSVLLASWWSFLGSGIGAILLILRTYLEDQTLKKELAGYADYAARVRYRLLPGIW